MTDELSNALASLFDTVEQDKPLKKEPLTNNNQTNELAHQSIRDKHQRILQTYQRQNEMRRRSNQAQTAFLKAITEGKTERELLTDAIELIGLLIDDTAYKAMLLKRLEERNAHSMH